MLFWGSLGRNFGGLQNLLKSLLYSLQLHCILWLGAEEFLLEKILFVFESVFIVVILDISNDPPLRKPSQTG